MKTLEGAEIFQFRLHWKDLINKHMLSYLSRYTTLWTLNIFIAEIIDNFAVLGENVYSSEERSGVLELVDMYFKSSDTMATFELEDTSISTEENVMPDQQNNMHAQLQ
jgi:hypothetical protein